MFNPTLFIPIVGGVVLLSVSGFLMSKWKKMAYSHDAIEQERKTNRTSHSQEDEEDYVRHMNEDLARRDRRSSDSMRTTIGGTKRRKVKGHKKYTRIV